MFCPCRDRDFIALIKLIGPKIYNTLDFYRDVTHSSLYTSDF